MRIACIGNIVLDKTAVFDAPLRLGGKNSTGQVDHATGGPASTAASVIARDKNHQVDFYGQIGRDSDGKYVWEAMKEEGINMDHVCVDEKDMTPNGFIAIDPSGERTIFSMSKQNNHGFATITAFNYEVDYDYILTDGKFGAQSIELIEANRKNNPNCISIIDAGRWNNGVIEVCKHVDYIICSEEFAVNVSNMVNQTPDKTFSDIYGDLKKLFPQAKGITITIGERGYICEQNNQITSNPAFDPQVPTIDTNGAGDIYHGAFTRALASGYDYFDSLEFANITAAISTTEHGGRYSCPDLKVVDKIMEQPKLTRKYKKFPKK